MTPIKNGIGLLTAVIVGLSLPASAMGGPVVPPENSAATQYTETVPSAGGDRDAGGGDRKGKVAPGDVLGQRKADRLEAQGATGREVAEVVAATAPVVNQTAAPSQPAGSPNDASEDNSLNGASPAGSADGGTPNPSSGSPTESTGQPKGSSDLPDGASGLGEVLAEATGSSSSDQLGGLLPLLLGATLLWAFAYAWRQRRRTD